MGVGSWGNGGYFRVGVLGWWGSQSGGGDLGVGGLGGWGILRWGISGWWESWDGGGLGGLGILGSGGSWGGGDLGMGGFGVVGILGVGGISGWWGWGWGFEGGGDLGVGSSRGVGPAGRRRVPALTSDRIAPSRATRSGPTAAPAALAPRGRRSARCSKHRPGEEPVVSGRAACNRGGERAGGRRRARPGPAVLLRCAYFFPGNIPPARPRARRGAHPATHNSLISTIFPEPPHSCRRCRCRYRRRRRHRRRYRLSRRLRGPALRPLRAANCACAATPLPP